MEMLQDIKHVIFITMAIVYHFNNPCLPALVWTAESRKDSKICLHDFISLRILLILLTYVNIAVQHLSALSIDLPSSQCAGCHFFFCKDQLR